MKQHKSSRGRGGDYESEEDENSSKEELKVKEEEEKDTKLSTWKSWLKSTRSRSRDGSSTSTGRDMVANGSTTPAAKGLFIDLQNWYSLSLSLLPHFLSLPIIQIQNILRIPMIGF